MRRVIAAVGFAVLLSFAIACGSRAKPTGQNVTVNGGEPVKEDRQEKPFDFDFRAIAKEWSANSVACKDKHFGKWYYVSGQIWDIVDNGVTMRGGEKGELNFVVSMPKEEILKLRSRKNAVIVAILVDFDPQYNPVSNAGFTRGFVKSIDGVVVAEKTQ